MVHQVSFLLWTLYPAEVANEFTSFATRIADLKKCTKHPHKIFVISFSIASALSKSTSISLWAVLMTNPCTDFLHYQPILTVLHVPIETASWRFSKLRPQAMYFDVNVFKQTTFNRYWK